MKGRFYSFSVIVSAFALVLLQACDNGQADVEIFDSPPRIEVVKPINFTSPNFKLKLKFYDGADPSISSSPLTSADYEITTMSDVSVKKGTLSVNGVFTEINEPISGIAKGKYKLKINATDTNGNKVSSESQFEILESLGIIGDGLSNPVDPGNAWAADVDMQVSSTDADIYTLTASLKTGEVKFRTNNTWDPAGTSSNPNWGRPDSGSEFPEATGKIGGENIKVQPGSYDISIDVSNGKYKFVKK
jgi:hypothetical protein